MGGVQLPRPKLTKLCAPQAKAMQQKAGLRNSAMKLAGPHGVVIMLHNGIAATMIFLRECRSVDRAIGTPIGTYISACQNRSMRD